MSTVRLLRVALSVAFIALASGVPNAVLAAFDEGDCGAPCEADAGGKRCPPNCTQGTCARSIFSVSDPVLAAEAPLPDSTELASAGVAAPVLPLVTRGVFHPPRR